MLVSQPCNMQMMIYTDIEPFSGLFAPRAGQHFRDEQRRRRSQYDRGTRLAELEDSYDDLDYKSKRSFPKQNQGWPPSYVAPINDVINGY